MVVGGQQLEDTKRKVKAAGYQTSEERVGSKCGLLESRAPVTCLRYGTHADHDPVLPGRVFKCCSRLSALDHTCASELELELNTNTLMR